MDLKKVLILCFFFTPLFAFQSSLSLSRAYALNITEPSGLACNNLDGTLYTHNDGLNANIYQITTSGIVLDTLFINGQDCEGIAFNAGFDTLFTAEEFTSRVAKYTPDGTLIGYIDVDIESGLNGLEGITINPENGHIFVVKEKNLPLLVELLPDGQEIYRDTLNFLGGGDASGITIHPAWNTLFILSHENHAIYETTLQGKYLRNWDIPVGKAEGIAFNASLDSLYVVDDLVDSLYVFSFKEKPFIHNLLINEFMAANTLTISDNNGDFDDWIELYNPNNYSVDIGGLSIADNFTRSGLWQIPKGFSGQTTIPAKGYIVLWADEQTGQGSLHINMKLNKSGEQIAVYNDLFLLDSLSFPPQTDDISYGRQNDGTDIWAFFSPSSPNESNSNGNIVSDLEKPELSLASTFELSQNYPNPFNPLTTIEYDVKSAKTQYAVSPLIDLSIYNMTGQKVLILVNKRQSAGHYAVTFSAGDLSSGIYFYSLKTKNFITTKKMILLK